MERTEGCLERAGEGVVDAGGAALSGLGNMVGISYSDDQGLDWSLSTAGDAWKGIGMFGVGALTFGPAGFALAHVAPGPVGKFLRDSQFMVPATVAGLVAIDLYAEDPLHQWKEDGAHASGETLFNVATLPLAALKVSNLGKLGRLGRAVPDAPDVPVPRKLPDGTDSVRGVDVSDINGLTQRADLDESLSIRTDLDLDVSVGKADGDGPPTGRSDGADGADGGSGPADRPEIGAGSGMPDDPRGYGYENPPRRCAGHRSLTSTMSAAGRGTTPPGPPSTWSHVGRST